MIYGYARVSSKEQNLNRQIDKLNTLCDVVYTEKQSGKDTDRPQLKDMLSRLQENDLLIITSLDRLSRDYVDCVSLWSQITRDIKANIKVLDMPLLDTTTTINGLDSKFISDLFIQILSYVAQKERENIKERQRQGIVSAKSRGVKFGASVSVSESEFKYHYDRVMTGSISVSQLCKELNIKSRKTFYNLRDRYITQ